MGEGNKSYFSDLSDSESQYLYRDVEVLGDT